MVEYYPILKGKTGELIALKHLTATAPEMIPVMQIIDDDTPACFFQKLMTHYPHTVYIDTSNNPNEDSTCSLLNSFISYAQGNGISAYPIVNYLDIQYIPANTNRCAIYLPIPYDFNGPSPQQIVQNIENQLNGTGAEIDLFLNAGFVSDQISANQSFQFYLQTLQQIINNPIITRFIICLTSFPEDISSVHNGQTASYERLDYPLFRVLRQSPLLESIKNKLHYSDYGVTKYTDTDIDFRLLRHGVLPKIKYTTDNQYVILKGSHNPTISYIDLANNLVRSPYFYPPEFSFGDDQIYQKSLGTNGTGNNANWVTYCCNHHLAAVLRQLSMIV